MARIFQLLLIFVASHQNYLRFLRRYLLQPRLRTRLQILSNLNCADCSVADRVRGGTGRNIRWTKLTDRTLVLPPAFRRQYREESEAHEVLTLGSTFDAQLWAISKPCCKTIKRQSDTVQNQTLLTSKLKIR